MCSRHPEEDGAGTDPALWTHDQETLPEWKPEWVKRAVNGGWDTPQTAKYPAEVIDSGPVKVGTGSGRGE